jgi:hypothetical protein
VAVDVVKKAPTRLRALRRRRRRPSRRRHLFCRLGEDLEEKTPGSLQRTDLALFLNISMIEKSPTTSPSLEDSPI